MARGKLGKHLKFFYGEKPLRTPLYQVWCAMRDRCNSPNKKNWNRYGGRGIRVCPEWGEFDPFADWALVNGWAVGLTIDRIDGDGDYCPNNCQFLTKSENASKHTQTPLKKSSDQQNVRLAHAKNRKTVRCVETGITFQSLTEAESSVGASCGLIGRAIRLGIRAKGYHWEFVE